MINDGQAKQFLKLMHPRLCNSRYMLQNISPAKADTYFEQGKLTDWRTPLGPIGLPPPDKNWVQFLLMPTVVGAFSVILKSLWTFVSSSRDYMDEMS